MGPVFAFDVCVVVFLVFSGTRKLHRFISFFEIIVEEMVEEFSAIIEIYTEDVKREGVFHIFDLPGNFPETFTVGGTLFCPAGGNVDGIGGKSVDSLDGTSAVSNSVCFKEPGSEFIPLSCFNRDMVFEKETGLGGASSFAAVEVFDGFEDAFDGGR